MSRSVNFSYHRRPTSTVHVGNTTIGGDAPIRLQSMTSTSTMDTEASVAQIMRIADAGADIVRLTAQGVREGDNLGIIRENLRNRGVNVPLVADIHFNPRAAFAAAPNVEKVRINPGNFVDPGRTFKKLEFTDEEYSAELQRIDDALTPFLELCRANGTALRIGVNHGSLSDRIMSHYGDTPAGMVESAMEFLRVCLKRGFTDVVISIKASNVRVMVETVRRLVKAMDAEDMHFPLHLGVTEAGDGEDGRVKSAVGIGTLLSEGIGDTIRVSLSEEPECEIPVAGMITDYISAKAAAPAVETVEVADDYDPIMPQRRMSRAIGTIGGANVPVVVIPEAYEGQCDGVTDSPDFIAGEPGINWLKLNAESLPDPATIFQDAVILLSTGHPDYTASMQSAIHRLTAAGVTNPIIATAEYSGISAAEATVRASIDLGTLLMNGLADGIMLKADSLTPRECVRLMFTILQSTRLRMTRTEYIACPGCGRTLFDLQSTLHRVREATKHLKGLKIGVMGCIVNGPGEMADADYGYVGAGVGHVSLYKGKQCVEKNIPTDQAVDRLIRLIKEQGDWKEI